MKYLLFMIIILGSWQVKSQVGMTGNNPDKSAALDLSATNKGLLIPRVNLINTSTAFPITNPATSLLVYNLNPIISGVGANGTGYYYWEGIVWKKVVSSSDTVGDNLGNHLAEINLDMNNKNIVNIYSAYVKNDIKLYDSIINNTNYFSLIKNNGILEIWNSKSGTSALSIDETTSKTTITSAAISKGIDNVLPSAGSIATAADNFGNIVWKPATANIVVPKLVGLAKTGTTVPIGTNVFFDTKLVDNENAFSGTISSGTTYTIKKDALYQIFVNLTVATTTIGGNWYLVINKNDSSIGAIDATTASGASAVVFAIDNFIVGDRITVIMGGSAEGYKQNLTKIAVFRFE